QNVAEKKNEEWATNHQPRKDRRHEVTAFSNGLVRLGKFAVFHRPACLEMRIARKHGAGVIEVSRKNSNVAGQVGRYGARWTIFPCANSVTDCATALKAPTSLQSIEIWFPSRIFGCGVVVHEKY